MTKKNLPIYLAIFVIILWLFNLLLIFIPDHGTFGDMFGAVNALYSGLAFAGVIYAIVLQSEELRLQREELSATRSELSGQREQFTQQTELQKKQSFENTFFQLITLHNAVVREIQYKKPGGLLFHGRECFPEYGSVLKEKYLKHCLIVEISKGDALKGTYAEFYDEMKISIGHYFRSIYNILKLIQENDIDNKRLYSNILRSQLSHDELILLFYNGVGYEYGSSMKKLVEEYAILRGLDHNLLFKPDHHQMYSTGAYNDQ